MSYLTKEIDYAIQFMIALKGSGEEKPLSLAAFAKHSAISFLFLQKIAKKLRAAKLVQSRLGNLGGYWLNRGAAEISLGDIIEAIEGPVAVVPCMRGTHHCRHASVCAQRHKFFGLNQEIKNFFGRKNLNQL